ncbi:hypothetical protein [Cupriavidus necator]
MTEAQIEEAMRLAGLMATARCVRLTTKQKGDPVAIAQVEVRVAKATRALREYLASIK